MSTSHKIERALLSVSDKRGLVELARALRAHGIELVSSGGTAKMIADADIPVVTVSDYTGAPEILDGRVKTLHPKVFGGILARPTEEHEAQLREHTLGRIDLVVVNLYPFEQTLQRGDATSQEIVEQIDIGGPSLLRAAAKNHERVAVVVDPDDYPKLLEELQARQGGVGDRLRRELAAAAFAHTAAYDVAISTHLSSELAQSGALAESLGMQLERVQSLRYGENPHQRAGFYRAASTSGADRAALYEQLSGKDLSYNNIVDADAAWALACDLPDAAVAVVKHTNPCGAAATHGDVAEAFRRALAGDPLSAFGGIVACNQAVTEAMAAELKPIFLEAVIAPEFDPAALEILRKKKKLRILQVPRPSAGALVWRSAFGGMLVQQRDDGLEAMAEAKVVTKRAPSDDELRELDFAWRACKHVKSNAIVFARDRQLVGVGAGQMSRVDSVTLAQRRAVLPIDGGVAASDAFFPFRDGLDGCAAAGVRAVVQPGGSVRDEEVIAAADEHGLAMIFTGRRHFRH
ncbi:MAG: bifunctional phosphoribosylaminoimidazolecarboxamide formyltransferase/inosine monophosphate cyclohydrolase [Deltaproteobacteria bacterium]|nr:MAG: bifunctional phosphoribosylaminoimidazolecarboxamide formyltransferase/inosine monophosphate cyclohydrolase [Pseudomonadota bacterium]PIE66341.1 MAG: bifunctional phosphoribosylaminoimidazolecarboxamide formyltransferase/inosine monophosphate cyclohydrolase [Deltaproteobacteria bacterium]